jgi:NAD(P)-dependent dehydrogenase (short-subunit alcohol dehydrogenase family)
MSRFAGKVALVTGAGEGIGRAIAEAFVAEGARVLALDAQEARVKQAARELAGRGGSVEPFVADVSRRADVRKAVLRCVERFGGPDLLVANAGISGSAPFLELDDSRWP